MRLIDPRLRTVRRWLGTCIPCAMVCAGLLLAALPIRAQDVAEAARQERARKAAEQKSQRHVYTNDDLKREHILTPSDEARAEARKKSLPAPASNPQPAMDADTNSAAGSLGEIARRYREEREAREAEEALKKQPTSGYPMNVPAPELAAPKNSISPRAFVSPTPPKVSPRAPREFRPSRPFVPKKISPFQPRPYSAPRIPEAPSRELRAAPVAPIAPGAPARAPRMRKAIPELPPVSAIHGKFHVVMVKSGDSWWKLSREYLGNGSRWRELFASNPGEANPDELMAGREVLIPVEHVSVPSREATNITVHRGDTLWSIARARFGSGTAWTCIASSNPEIADPNVILPGQMIRAPKSCSRKP